MSWSIKLGTVAGSEIRVHLTFFLLLLWIGLAHLEDGTAAAIEGIAFIIAIFACVTLHELGHALAARRYGIATPDITLLPIGGVARLERMPQNPVAEIVIALAGPAVNVVIAAILILILGAQPEVITTDNFEDPSAGFLARLAAVNVFLVVFNMIPAFPMDGGRVFRAVLAIWTGRERATRVAATVGQGVAFLFGFIGLVGGNPLLIFIAIFVFLAANAENSATGMAAMAKGLTVDDAMITSYETLGPQSTLDDAAHALIRTTQHEFPVVDGGGHPRGILTRRAMIAGMGQSGPEGSVLDVMEEFPAVDARSRLEPAIEPIFQDGAQAVAVTDGNGRLVGYLSRENLSELMMLRMASRRG